MDSKSSSKIFKHRSEKVGFMGETNWISVEEKLPERNQKVLVYIVGDADPEINVSDWDEKDDKPSEDGYLYIRWYYEGQPMYSTSWYQKVTHWSLLPEPPKPHGE